MMSSSIRLAEDERERIESVENIIHIASKMVELMTVILLNNLLLNKERKKLANKRCSKDANVKFDILFVRTRDSFSKNPEEMKPIISKSRENRT